MASGFPVWRRCWRPTTRASTPAAAVVPAQAPVAPAVVVQQAAWPPVARATVCPAAQRASNGQLQSRSRGRGRCQPPSGGR